MRKANRKINGYVGQRLAEVRLSPRERERALQAMQNAEAIVDAIVWLKAKVSDFGTLLAKPHFKH